MQFDVAVLLPELASSLLLCVDHAPSGSGDTTGALSWPGGRGSASGARTPSQRAGVGPASPHAERGRHMKMAQECREGGASHVL